MLRAPSVKSITGVEFVQSHPKAPPVPKSPLSTGRIMGAVGTAGALLDLAVMLRVVFDRPYESSLLCQMNPNHPHCLPSES